MPPAIAQSDIVSEPKRYEDWQIVVQHLIQHISGTRGISDVYYEVWNEPDLFGHWKYGGKKIILLYIPMPHEGLQIPEEFSSLKSAVRLPPGSTRIGLMP